MSGDPFLNLRQIATPKGNPQPGGNLLYFKSDGKLYTKNSSGVETAVETALGDVTLTGVQTLTNKTLTAPKVDQLNDASGDKALEIVDAASGANFLQVTAAASLATPQLAAAGFDANISLNLVPKGTGVVKLNGVNAVDVSTTQTLTNKTLSTGTKVGAATTDISGAWTAYTPTVTGWALGNGTSTGAFMQIGKTVLWRASVTAGTTTTFASTLSVSLPVAASASWPVEGLLGMTYLTDQSASAHIIGSTRLLSGAAQFIYTNSTVTNIVGAGGANPWTWATSDSASVSGTYEAA